MFARIAAKIAKHQFLSKSEYQCLAEMFAKIRTALTQIDCQKLRAIETYYSNLMTRAKCASKSVKLQTAVAMALRAQFCYDAAGFGYFKF